LQFKIATLIPETPKCDEHINQVLRTFARNIAYCKYRILDSRIKAVYGKLYNLRQPLDLTRCPHRARCYNPRFLMPKNVPIRDGIRPIPLLDLNRQYLLIRPAVLSAIERVCSSQQFVLGQEVDALERELAAYVGAAHAIGCASGTDALWLSLAAAGVGPGDRVITTPFSFFASASSIVRAGAQPIFVDVDPGSLNLSPARVRSALGNARNGERSGIRIRRVVPRISWLLWKGFFWRLREKYVIRDFHPLVFFYALGFLMTTVGLALGVVETVQRIGGHNIPAATIVLVALLLISGSQFTLFAMWFDMESNKDLR